MLSEDIKKILEEQLKFRAGVFEVLDELAQKHSYNLFVSQNKFQPESRLGKPFGIVFNIAHTDLVDAKGLLKEKLPNIYNHYEIQHADDVVTVAIIRPTDKFEIIRIQGTNSEEKHDLDTGTLLARLRRWEAEHGLELHGAGENWVKFELASIPGELREFVQELTTFAPGTLEIGDIRDIEKQLRESRIIRISW